jgi:hypothetical protein
MGAQTIEFSAFMSGEYKTSWKKKKTPQWRNLKEITKRIAPVPIISFLSSKYALAGPQEAAPEVVEVVAQSTKDSIVRAFDPLLELMIELSLPIAGLMITGGCLLILIGMKERGYSLIFNSSLGYCLVQLSPLFLSLLEEIGKAL